MLYECSAGVHGNGVLRVKGRLKGNFCPRTDSSPIHFLYKCKALCYFENTMCVGDWQYFQLLINLIL